MALWDFGAKSVMEWVSGVDTPWTITTTRAPAVLIISADLKSLYEFITKFSPSVHCWW